VHYKNRRALLVWMWLGIAVEAGLAQGLAPARPQEVALSPERLEPEGRQVPGFLPHR